MSSGNIARFFKVPQWTVPWGLHERLWPIKYIIFLALFHPCKDPDPVFTDQGEKFHTARFPFLCVAHKAMPGTSSSG